MNNPDIILEALKKNSTGLNLSAIERKTILSKGPIRTAIAFLEGAGLVFYKKKGKSKTYFLIGDKE